jgi:hypothetical protein
MIYRDLTYILAKFKETCLNDVLEYHFACEYTIYKEENYLLLVVEVAVVVEFVRF